MLKQVIQGPNIQSNRLIKSKNAWDSDNEKEQDNKTAVRRRNSLGGEKTIKKNDAFMAPRRTANEFPLKKSYKLSTDVISFEMDEQRNNQMRIIAND